MNIRPEQRAIHGYAASFLRGLACRMLLCLATVIAITFATSPAWASSSREKTEDPQYTPLVLAFIPQENPEKLLGDITKVSTYLAAEFGVEIKGFVTQDQAAAVEALRNGDADVSFMGALPYVLAHKEIEAKIIFWFTARRLS